MSDQTFFLLLNVLRNYQAIFFYFKVQLKLYILYLTFNFQVFKVKDAALTIFKSKIN